ncbi:hypothetical protein ACFLWW_03290 [Chloroflexota bacterium]
MDAKSYRLVTTTLLGAAFGILCMLLSNFTVGVAYWPMGISFLLHHTVMGLAIGASSLKMDWTVHGVFWGAVFGLFLAISRVWTIQPPWMVFIAVVIWAFLIEALTTKVFKRPQL